MQLNEIKTKKATHEKEKLVFEKINKVDKPLGRLQRKTEKLQINKIQNKKGLTLISQKYQRALGSISMMTDWKFEKWANF